MSASARSLHCRASQFAGVLALTLVAQATLAAPDLPERLVKSNKLTFCSSMDSPPLAYFDEQQKPKGMSVDVAEDVARTLGGLKIDWRVMPFAGMVPALLAQQCDLVIDQLFDKPERREIINIVNYMYASQSVVVPQGNPKGIDSLTALSGLKVAALNGSTIRVLLEAENEKLVAAGQKPMTIVVYNTDNDAFQALRLQQVDAFGTTVETAGYYKNIVPGLFEEAVPAFSQILTGIGIRKDDGELTEAVKFAVADLLQSERYLAMLKTWNVETDKLDY
ncbi:ABC transporter substrate-binding protein [Pseudomonas daroniae]|uniref:ABC transporter substrate-binding protein n=1 Tax=Phytopseudomonas daroniae TaxID=2487519 RepID=A0A4Q9QGJ1_9GAMM|nr:MULTISPECIES: ABC transporter substrate-binding protein [Pseudomonas]TBU73048.1 ABC transporter substrate-binding protein [Pseudomonas daroniae]TBU75300.1 ABC transporter substrate-binding protein [Pseudomonas daroniae]TBU77839.1 ABC transporter substrate-binding protein [Pseudomonas sp. FRB 228]TBU87820.1 ABC transporter substrate-binding protein [Pseudomonas daroniae]